MAKAAKIKAKRKYLVEDLKVLSAKYPPIGPPTNFKVY